jgi:hypothetical protein
VSILGGESVSAALPDIHLKDVGKKKEGVSPAKAFEEVFAALYGGITSQAVTDSLNQGIKALGSRMDEVSEGAKKELGGVTDKVKGLLGQ